MEIEQFKFWGEIVLLFLAVYLAFFKSYFTEKGKNLATQQDIDKITNTVEKIKGDISVLTQRQIGLAATKQQMIVDFTTKYAAFFHTLVVGRFYEHNEDAGTFHDGMKTKVFELMHSYLGIDANMEVLFADDKELLDLKDVVRNNTFEILNFYTYQLNDFRIKGEEIARLQHSLYELRNVEDGAKAMAAITERLEILKEVTAKRNEMHNNIEPFKIKLYQLFHNRIVDFQKF